MSGPNSGSELVVSGADRLEYARRIAKKTRLTDNGCLEWTGARVKGKDTRPVMKFEGRIVKAYRVAVACVFGRLPAGSVVAHKCDNPMCVRPSHLEITTQSKNMADMDTKGRRSVGAYRGKLSKDDVAALYDALDSGMSQRKTGALFGISGPAVCRWASKRTTAIKRGR